MFNGFGIAYFYKHWGSFGVILDVEFLGESGEIVGFYDIWWSWGG